MMVQEKSQINTSNKRKVRTRVNQLVFSPTRPEELEYVLVRYHSKDMNLGSGYLLYSEFRRRRVQLSRSETARLEYLNVEEVRDTITEDMSYITRFRRFVVSAISWTFQTTLSILDWIRLVTLTIITRVLEFLVLSWLTVYYVVEAVVLTLTPPFLRSQKSLKGKVVLVTGGAGGVGQELALRLARIKAKVVIWDINEKALEKVQEKLEAEGFKSYVYPVDVSDKENVYKYAEMVKNDVGPVDVLINNAGIVCGQTFLEIPDYMIEKTFKVNILSNYWTTKAFLPDMIKAGKGHIATVGSLTGLLGTYKCTDYSASKHASIGFHESLSIELKTHGHNINTTLVCPYFINTGMFSGCKPRSMNMLEPRDVAKRIITAIRRNEVYVTMPTASRFILPVKNFLPAKLNWMYLHRVIQGPQSMMGMRNFQEVEAA